MVRAVAMVNPLPTLLAVGLRGIYPPGSPPRITLTAPWTAPGGPGPYTPLHWGLGSRFFSVVVHVCGVWPGHYMRAPAPERHP